MTITKAHIINSIHMKNGLSKDKAASVVDSLFEIVKRTLEEGEDVMISRFGKFCVKDKKKREGRNPRSGDPMTLDVQADRMDSATIMGIPQFSSIKIGYDRHH